MTKQNIARGAYPQLEEQLLAQNNQLQKCRSKFRNALVRFNLGSTPILITETTSPSWLICSE